MFWWDWGFSENRLASSLSWSREVVGHVTLPRKSSPNTLAAPWSWTGLQTCKPGSKEPVVGAARAVLFCSVAQAETMTVTEAMI